ncbi:enoyl-CoA hydratase/isomerase family protein [Rhodococcus opacus]|uniref:enoyl-CoA hydratase/isomerase family protein n=1 Tax=Rhodococcus opacus TaxID=37919 RepID=UPI00294A019D|nr:enoyl-CoA hydratase/isomerase family protein [Rhodococcus opacus]MDV6246703.1 enoyl-CoA hydratase/isomerase family protein [Rhodococcus opacus]
MSEGVVSTEKLTVGDAVLSELRGNVGVITLNRPRQLNALTTPMVESIDARLAAFSGEGLRAVVLNSASPRAFCAGGDIRAIRDNSLTGDAEAIERFFATEYRLNHRIATSAVPVVSFIDGICMGGGMGLSIHGTFRVVTDNASFAMPETKIGFFPDVGASYFLSRLPGALGPYLGLTGARITAADALYCGLATHRVSAGAFDEVIEAIDHGESIHGALAGMAGSSESSAGSLAAHRAEIDWCFGARTVREVDERLSQVGGTWATTTRDTLHELSPQSLEVSLHLISWGRQRSLAQCLEAELNVARKVVKTEDFIEGVRAALVDKDQRPLWGESRFRGADSAGRATWNVC